MFITKHFQMKNKLSLPNETLGGDTGSMKTMCVNRKKAQTNNDSPDNPETSCDSSQTSNFSPPSNFGLRTRKSPFKATHQKTNKISVCERKDLIETEPMLRKTKATKSPTRPQSSLPCITDIFKIGDSDSSAKTSRNSLISEAGGSSKETSEQQQTGSGKAMSSQSPVYESSSEISSLECVNAHDKPQCNDAQKRTSKLAHRRSTTCLSDSAYVHSQTELEDFKFGRNTGRSCNKWKTTCRRMTINQKIGLKDNNKMYSSLPLLLKNSEVSKSSTSLCLQNCQCSQTQTNINCERLSVKIPHQTEEAASNDSLK